MRRLASALVLWLACIYAHAAELTLFDVVLRTATRDEIRNAVTHAGGELKSSKGSTDVFEVTRIGLPGATHLEAVYLDGVLVLAQYTVPSNHKSEERLRKMLVAKYGQPAANGKFDAEYIGDGKYSWEFDSGMRLIFKKAFFPSTPTYLTYLNPAQEAKLEALVKEADRRSVNKEAAAKGKVF